MQQPTPWWNTLPDDYYRLAAMVSSALTPLLAFPEIRRRELDAVAFYDDLAALGDPSRVFLRHKHCTGSRMHGFPGNHVLHLHQRRYLRLMRDFIGQSLGDMVDQNPE